MLISAKPGSPTSGALISDGGLADPDDVGFAKACESFAIFVAWLAGATPSSAPRGAIKAALPLTGTPSDPLWTLNCASAASTCCKRSSNLRTRRASSNAVTPPFAWTTSAARGPCTTSVESGKSEEPSSDAPFDAPSARRSAMDFGPETVAGPSPCTHPASCSWTATGAATFLASAAFGASTGEAQKSSSSLRCKESTRCERACDTASTWSFNPFMSVARTPLSSDSKPSL
mmetsp:Transcript_99849/g.286828  ORF Transcript_99849/g.286828 Transcript_99849/m.286828 type:complete len:231 (+) Transcript_99849:2443-3135(+)